MIVDVHVHALPPGCAEAAFLDGITRAHGDGSDVAAYAPWQDYVASAPQGTVAVVFGGKARRSGLWVDDGNTAALARQHTDAVIGFMAIDPTSPGWQDDLRYGHQELALRGIKIMPMYAGFNPADECYDDLFAYAERHHMPVIAHTGTTFVTNAPLEFARPVHFDTVAIRHPGLPIVLAHLGHPYEGECIAVIRKHPNVYADISALHYRPFQLWHSLRLVQDYGVWHKVLFGSDFPFTTVDESVAGLRRVAAVDGVPGLDPLDRDQVEGIVQRDARPLLGLA